MNTKATVLDVLQNVMRDQEADFLRQLKALGSHHLAAVYGDIVAARRTYDLVLRSQNGTFAVMEMKSQRENEAPAKKVGKRSDSLLPELGFSLRDSVRELVPSFGNKLFNTRQMFEALQDKHGSDVIGEDRLASVSATLANMYTKKELEKVVGPQRKVKFRSPDGKLNLG